MDLTWSADGGGVPARGAGVAGGERAARPAVGRHPRGLRPAPRVGAAAVRRPVGGRVVGCPSTAVVARRCGSGCCSRRSTTEPAVRSGSRRTASSCSPRRSTSSARAAQRDGILPRMAAAEDLWCQGWSEPGAGSDLAAVSSRARRVDGGWVLDGQKTWTTRGAFCTHLFGLFRSDPASASGTRASPTCSCRSTRPASPCAASAASTATRGSPRCSSTTPSSPTTPCPAASCSASEGQGWGVAMATAGSERGLTLRSPGRFLATAERLLDLYRAPGATTRVLRRRVVDAWMKAEAYQLQTLPDGDAAGRRREARRRGEMTKVWWSELDVELHEVADRPPRRRRRARGPVGEGLAVLAVGPDLRRHERDPAQHRRRARPRAARDDEVRLDRRSARVPRRRPRPAGQGVPAGVVRRRGTRRRRLDRGVGEPRRMGVLGVLVPEADGGLGLDECALVPVLEETGRAALPHPIVETAMVAAPLGVARRPDRDRRARRDRLPCLLDADAVRRRARRLARASSSAGRRRRRSTTVDPRPAGSADSSPARGVAAHRRSRRRRPRLRPRRARHGRAARRPVRAMLDLAVAHVTDRQQFGVPDRQLPGGEAPPRRRRASPSSSPRRRSPGRRGRSRSDVADACTRRVDGQGARHRRRLGHGPGVAAVPRRHRVHGRARPAPASSSGRGRCRGRGATAPSTPSASPRRSIWSAA